MKRAEIEANARKPYADALIRKQAEIDELAIGNLEAQHRAAVENGRLRAAFDNILGIATNDNSEAGEHELRARMNQIAQTAKAALSKG